MNRRSFFRRAMGVAVGLIGARGVPFVKELQLETPKFILNSIPLPIVHTDFWITCTEMSALRERHELMMEAILTSQCVAFQTEELRS